MTAAFMFLPLLHKLGDLAQRALTQYGVLAAQGSGVTPEALAAFLDGEVTDWNPEVAGRRVLDAETRRAGTRFLAGVIVNYSKGGVRP